MVNTKSGAGCCIKDLLRRTGEKVASTAGRTLDPRSSSPKINSTLMRKPGQCAKIIV